MLEAVSNGFKSAKSLLTGKVALTETNIIDALTEIRLSLLEADVDLAVVKGFLDRVKKRALGEVVQLEVQSGKKKLKTSPGDHFTAICQEELENLMGPVEGAPIIFSRPVTSIMMVGLQGTGKTTTSAKLAMYLRKQKRRPLLVAADVYRPAAYEQLKILGEQTNIPVFHQPGLKPAELCKAALRHAREKKRDVIIYDTAGRLSIDQELMQELEDIKTNVTPENIFLVVDAMAGRDAVNTASEFNRRLALTGFIMTKLDGDARGGAALSIKEVTGKPIKFIGVGEGLDNLEEFRPDGLASRILGMGDVIGLMKDFEAVVDEKQAKQDTKKLLSGQFTLDDFVTQMKTIKQLGSMSDIMERFPLFGDQGMPDGMKVDDGIFTSFESMISSMTKSERIQPSIIDDSRAQRIASGSGRKVEQVKDLVGRFSMMQTMMKNISAQPGLLGALPGFKQLAQMRKMKGMDMSDLFGDMPKMAKGRMPQAMGMPNLGSMPGGMPEGYPEGMPMDMNPFGQSGFGKGKKAPISKAKAKAKRKAAKKSRKKSRKK